MIPGVGAIYNANTPGAVRDYLGGCKIADCAPPTGWSRCSHDVVA